MLKTSVYRQIFAINSSTRLSTQSRHITIPGLSTILQWRKNKEEESKSDSTKEVQPSNPSTEKSNSGNVVRLEVVGGGRHRGKRELEDIDFELPPPFKPESIEPVPRELVIQVTTELMGEGLSDKLKIPIETRFKVCSFPDFNIEAV